LKERSESSGMSPDNRNTILRSGVYFHCEVMDW
jgi:hypothetical protein